MNNLILAHPIQITDYYLTRDSINACIIYKLDNFFTHPFIGLIFLEGMNNKGFTQAWFVNNDQNNDAIFINSFNERFDLVKKIKKDE